MGCCFALTACASATSSSTTQPSSAPAASARSSAASVANTGAAASATADGAARWKQRLSDPACRATLTALARTELAAVHLGRCGRIDAEEALGGSGDAPSRFEPLGESRVYRYAGNSVHVWLLADDIRVLQLLYPKLTQPLTTQLGEPDAKRPSQLSNEWEQWIYAGRGLAAHVKPATGEVITLFAFVPTTVAAFLETDIAHISKSEDPIEELK